MFPAPLCPSSGVQGCTLLHMVFSTVCCARNMLSYWFINKSQLLHQVGLTNHFIPLHILHSFRRSIIINHFKAFILSDTTVVPPVVPAHNKNVKAEYILQSSSPWQNKNNWNTMGQYRSCL